jgi:NADH dehydrogenase
MKPKHIVVLGGTGFVGHSVCERLVEREGGGGGRIVVPTRRWPHGLAVQSLPTVELVRASVHDDAQLARVLEGADAVINLVAILHGSAPEFQRVHVELPRRIAAACRAGGVHRLVHVSALGVGPDAPSNYLRSKTAGEQVLKEAGLELTILRPSVIFGARDQLTNLFARLQALLPVVPLAGASSRYQPVWVEDVAAAVAACLDRRQTIGQVIECAGPDVLTLADLVRLSGRAAGHERPVIPLPGPAARVQALLMELAPGAPLMSRDNLDSMKVPNVATGTLPGLESLGITPASIAAVLPEYLGTEAGTARLERWRARRA